MSEEWKKYDRPCPPCANCGVVLYEKFWGNGGWAKTEKSTDKTHGASDCVKRMAMELKRTRAIVDEAQVAANCWGGIDGCVLIKSGKEWAKVLDNLRTLLSAYVDDEELDGTETA
jgi:hypothetical protein